MHPHQSSRLVSEGSGKPSGSMQPHCLPAVDCQHLASMSNATSCYQCSLLVGDLTPMPIVYAIACRLSVPLYSWCCISRLDVCIDVVASLHTRKFCTSHGRLVSLANARGSYRQNIDIVGPRDYPFNLHSIPFSAFNSSEPLAVS